MSGHNVVCCRKREINDIFFDSCLNTLPEYIIIDKCDNLLTKRGGIAGFRLIKE